MWAEARTDAPPRRALYLLPREPVRMERAHGALRVCREGEAPRYIPVSRIERVLCNHLVDWSGRALELCLLSGVVICVQSGFYGTVGYGVPRLREDEPFHRVLERFVVNPDAHAWLDNWFRHRRMRALVASSREREEAGRTVPAAVFDDLKQRWVYRAEVVAVLPERLQGAVTSVLLSLFREAGIEPVYLDDEAKPVSIIEAWSNLIWGELNLAGGALLSGLEDECSALGFVEGWIAVRRERFVQDLREFAVFIARRSGE